MARAHYIVRIGNVGLAPTVTPRSPNHWHYLSPQHLWGLPRDMTHVKVRASFFADIANPHVDAYVWFLCNSYGGPGHFVQVGIGMEQHAGQQGPAANAALRIPQDMMAHLRQGFDHWFEWRPISPDPAFQDEVRRLQVPYPPFIPTLRRVTAEHSSFGDFEALVDRAEEQAAAGAAAIFPPPAMPVVPVPAPPLPIEADLENLRREQINPHSQGHVYLIHMEGTTFHKIGMSLDPQIRLRTLQTGNPHPLRILGTKSVQDMRSAEMGLHRMFEARRVPNVNVREWFDFGDGVAEVESALSSLEEQK